MGESRRGYDRSRPDATARPQSGCLLLDRERLLARVWPAAAPPGTFTYHYDTAGGGFRMSGETASAGEVVIRGPDQELRQVVGPGHYRGISSCSLCTASMTASCRRVRCRCRRTTRGSRVTFSRHPAHLGYQPRPRPRARARGAEVDVGVRTGTRAARHP